ncbi:MAG TPA: VCBS repeat-containing protein, partial [Thermoanaerobaculia bacterium]|nr:VCBS repeat-containing protein [Thermoanaerobaculia bacterium]
MPISRLCLIALLLAALPLSAQEAHQHGSQPPLPPGAASSPGGTTFVNVPAEDVGIDTLAAREQAERATVGQFKVFHDFKYTDRLPESGITFVHGIVDDAGKTYKAAHYDHGNGIAAADVDGDGKLDVYFPNQVGGSQLWKNLGDGRFQDITKTAGVGLPGRVTVSAAFADVDNDGDQDLFVTTVRMG